MLPPLRPLLLLLLAAASLPPSPSSLVLALEQNMCGGDFGDAMRCAAACPMGTDAECPGGESCYALVDCPAGAGGGKGAVGGAAAPRPPGSVIGPPFAVGRHEKQILGYYASWQWYDRSKLAKPSAMDLKKVTRVNFAFFQSDEEGNIWGTDEWADPRVLFGDVDAEKGECRAGEFGCRCSWIKAHFKSCNFHKEQTGLIWLAHQARADIYPSIGGWTLSDAFPAMSADVASRRVFARNCRNLIVEYNFDGIDLDWEYPGYAAHSGTAQDKHNFNLLLKDIRDELDGLGKETGRFYGLTAALPCGPSNINNIDILEVSKYLTEFNLMSYDFHGAWDARSGVNSPLYDQALDPEPGWSVDGCVRNWVHRGAPQERLNIGLGFYGRSFRNAKQLGAEHGGTDDTSWEIDEGTPQYFNIMDQIDDMIIQWDMESATPYAYFNDHKGGLVSYDDEQSICLKTEYALIHGLHGFIIWELSGDMMDDLSTPLLDMLNRKLSEETTNCADPFGPKLPMPLQPAPPLAPLPVFINANYVESPDIEALSNGGGHGGTAAVAPNVEVPYVAPDIEASYVAPDPPEEFAVPTTTRATVPTTTRATTTRATTTRATTTKATTMTTEATTTTTPETTTTFTTEATTSTSTSTSTTTTATPPAALATAALVAPKPQQFSSPAVESFAQFQDGRKRVKWDNKKPAKPYRPSKDARSEL